MNHPILHPDFRQDSFWHFVFACAIAMMIVTLCLILQVTKARAEDDTAKLITFGSGSDSWTQSSKWIMSETMLWCDKLSISDEDKRLLQAIILAHNATSQPIRFASSDIGYASWIKMMRYLYEQEKLTCYDKINNSLLPNCPKRESLLDFIDDWCNAKWNNYSNVWKDKVKIFLEEKREEINSDKSN